MESGIVGLEGYAPEVTIGKAPRPAESTIYEQMWKREEYRAVAPGELCAQQFIALAKPPMHSRVIDFGCGTGRGALHLALFAAMDVTMLDFAGNCLDEDIRPMLETQAQSLRFMLQDLTQPIAVAPAPYGYCTDVMEHIPPADVDRVLDNVLHAAQHVYFQIACEEDQLGSLIGHPLHLSVHNHAWWLAKFTDRQCVVHFSKDYGTHCVFYVSAWVSGKDIVEVGIMNTDDTTLRFNVVHNLEDGWQQVLPHETNDIDVMILGGGPSLNQHLAQIKAMRALGTKLICLNGAYNWAIENGLEPSAVVVVDAREFNARFVRPVIDGCKYFIASQCNPEVFEGLPKDRTYIWHSNPGLIKDLLDANYEDGVWYAIPGGSTVLLRAIPLFRMLGFKRFSLFGCDSCVVEENGTPQHHAYTQTENDVPAFPVVCGDKTFYCQAWMFAQAHEFMDLIAVFGNEFELEIYGDGLLAHILQTGATLQEEFDAGRAPQPNSLT